MATVHVSNISSSTSEKEIKDFFSFCGKITDIKVTPSSGAQDATLSAAVTFERDTAAKTAILLDNTQLGSSRVKVESSHSFDEMTDRSTTAGEAEHNEEIRQEDKPRTAVLAEYLSRGYVIGDGVLQKAIDLDTKHGVTTKFSNYLQQLDARTHATDKAKAVDNTYKVTDKAQQGVNVLQQYFESALGTPTGQKVREFYMNGAKQATDIHTEARRLADMRKPASSSSSSGDAGPAVPQGDGTTKCGCGGDEGVCACKPGHCSCSTCPRSDSAAKGEYSEKSTQSV